MKSGKAKRMSYTKLDRVSFAVCDIQYSKSIITGSLGQGEKPEYGANKYVCKCLQHNVYKPYSLIKK